MTDKDLKVFPNYDLIEQVENNEYWVHIFGTIRIKFKGKYYLAMLRLSNACHIDAPREDKKLLTLDAFMKEAWRYYHCGSIKRMLEYNRLSTDGTTMYCELDEDQRTEKQRLKEVYND